MNDPRVSALICGLVAAWLGYTIFIAPEAQNASIRLIQWPFFIVAIAGLAFALARILRERGE